MDTRTCRHGQVLASRGPREMLVRDKFVDEDGSRLRTVRGPFMSATADADWSWTWSVRGHGKTPGADCSRTVPCRGPAAFAAMRERYRTAVSGSWHDSCA